MASQSQEDSFRLRPHGAGLVDTDPQAPAEDDEEGPLAVPSAPRICFSAVPGVAAAPRAILRPELSEVSNYLLYGVLRKEHHEGAGCRQAKAAGSPYFA